MLIHFIYIFLIFNIIFIQSAFALYSDLQPVSFEDSGNSIPAKSIFYYNVKLKNNTAFLFYIDEEYDFAGIKAFIKKYKNKIKPKRIISLDGSNLKITNGCRGLIEITCTIQGKSGHAAKPQSGINAINNSFLIIQKLSNWLKKFDNKNLGSTCLNLAYIKGGQNQGKDKQNNLIRLKGKKVCFF